jgi:hypothetical protein
MLEKVKKKAKVYKINFDILFKNVDFVRNLEILGDDLTFGDYPIYSTYALKFQTSRRRDKV